MPAPLHAREGRWAEGVFGPHTHVLRKVDPRRPTDADCLDAVIRELESRSVSIMTRFRMPPGQAFRLVLAPITSAPPDAGPRSLVVAEFRTLHCEEDPARVGEFIVVGELLRTAGWQGNSGWRPAT